MGLLLFTYWSHSPISNQPMGPLFFKYQSCSEVSSQIPSCLHTDLIHLFLGSKWVPYCSYINLLTSSHSVNGILCCPHTGLFHQLSVSGSSIVHTLVIFASFQLVSVSAIIRKLVLFTSSQSSVGSVTFTGWSCLPVASQSVHSLMLTQSKPVGGFSDIHILVLFASSHSINESSIVYIPVFFTNSSIGWRCWHYNFKLNKNLLC
jgi:hypothetical protein